MLRRRRPQRKEYRDPSEVSDEELLESLRENRFSVKPTAKALNVSRTSLYSLIDRNPSIRKASDLERTRSAGPGEHGGDLDAMGRELEVSPPACGSG